MKKYFLGLVCLLLIAFGAYKNYPVILIVGIFTLAIILFFPIEIIRDCMAVYLKKKYDIDVLQEIKDDVIKDLSRGFTIKEEEKNKIYASITTASLATVTADIIISKKICLFCKKAEMKEMPWEKDLDKFIESENLVGKPQVYKCDNCGYKFIQYDEV
ncbi:MAG: hypothetical protein V1759_04480 [bacterium]